MSVLMKTAFSVIGILIGCVVHGQTDLNDFSIWKEKVEFDKFLEKSAKDAKSFFEDSSDLLIEFETILTQEDKIYLASQGLTVQNYFGNNTFLLSVKRSVSKLKLTRLPIRHIGLADHKIKYSPTLRKALFNSTEEEIDLVVIFHSDIEKEEQLTVLERFDVELLDEAEASRLVFMKIEQSEIARLAEEHAVQNIDLYFGKDEALNHEARLGQQVNMLQSNAGIGKGLNGNGVVVGVGDGGELGNHIDLINRVINEANGTYASFGAHGDHVAGTLAGVGNLDPRHKGMAPEATIVTQKTNLIVNNAENYLDEYGMVLTNNSYGVTFDCEVAGVYNYYSQFYDQQLFHNPELLHVFAVGNSGWAQCTDYPQSYRTILPGYQSAKNVLTVGCVDDERNIWASSSRGPTFDGRIKPEICGVGVKLKSMGNNYNYFQSSGTSMAAPAVTGTLALMVEAYRKKNGGDNPDGALMKAIACNTADDLGLEGPDYTYGFGLINGRRAVEAIEQDQYFENTIQHGDSVVHDITLPANVVGLKVLLHWRDREGNISVQSSLVSDLDLVLYQPSMGKSYPLILSQDASLVNTAAVPGVDTVNNIEQISLTNPEAGAYKLVVKGTDVPLSSQKYYLSYDYIFEDLSFVFPIGRESLLPNKYNRIQWDAEYTNTYSFTLEFSMDGGNSWILIDNNIPAEDRAYNWKTPNAIVKDTRLRITRNDGTDNHIYSNVCNILPIPLNFTATPICEGYVSLNWTSTVNGASIEGFRLDGNQMVSVGTTTENELIVRDDLKLGEQNWFAVRYKLADSIYSARCVAKFAIPKVGDICPWSDDFKVKNVQVIKGRNGTSQSLSANEMIQVPFRNVGNNDVSGVSFSYQINDQGVVTELLNTPINSGDSITYQFAQSVPMNFPDTFNISYWADLSTDSNPSNDSLANTLYAVQLENNPINLPLDIDFISSENRVYSKNYVGIEGAEQWDFINYDQGLLYYSASEKSLLIVAEGENDPTTANADLIATLNLSQYSSSGTEAITFHFDYRINTDAPFLPLGGSSLGEVWVRGSDQEDWILCYDNFIYDVWTTLPSLRLSKLLSDNNQSFSSSTQIKIALNSTKGLEVRSFRLFDQNSLPITLSYFQAEKFEETVQLHWKTDSELDNAFFEIEHAANEKDVAANRFETIAKVAGRGTSNEPQYYHFLHRDPNLFNSNYYRLKQVDFDGSFSYSELRVVDFDKNGVNVLIYPNPVHQHFFIELDSKKSEPVTVQLVDPIGKLVYQWESQLELGPNKMRFRVPSDFHAGVYTLRVKVNKELLSYRLMLFH